MPLESVSKFLSIYHQECLQAISVKPLSHLVIQGSFLRAPLIAILVR